MIFVCKKLYEDEIKPENFIAKENDGKWYPEKDYHVFLMKVRSCCCGVYLRVCDCIPAVPSQGVTATRSKKPDLPRISQTEQLLSRKPI